MGVHLPARYIAFSNPAFGKVALILVSEDVLKTRVQTWDLVSLGQASRMHAADASQPLLNGQPLRAGIQSAAPSRPSTFQIARSAYATEGISVFFQGLGVCSARAFIVNAVQWAVSTIHSHLSHKSQHEHPLTVTHQQVYEYLMKQLAQ